MTQTRLKGFEVVEEVEWLLGGGMSPEYVAETLGRSLSAVSKVCWRAGRGDLARPFDRASAEAKRKDNE